MNYQITFNGIILRSDGASIPQDSHNMDYIDFLLWVQDGNVAEQLPEPHPTRSELASQGIIANSIRTKLDAAILANIAATTALTAVGTKADGYAKNAATNLTTIQIVAILKDICAGIVITSQAIILAQQQLTGIEKILLNRLDTLEGT